MIHFVGHIVDPFWITKTFADFRHSFQNIFLLVRPYTPKRICAISLIGIDNIIVEKWLQTMSDLKYDSDFSYSILQGEAVFMIFETADNNLMMWILITESTDPARLSVVCVQTTSCYHKVNCLGKWHHYFMVVTCVLEWILCLGLLFVCWCDFLGRDLLPWVILFGYMVTWRMTSSLYGGHVNLGMIFFRLGWNFCLGVILFVLVSFYTLVRSTESWYDFLRLDWNFRLSVILFDLALFHILVRSTESWYDFLRFGRLFRLSVILSDLVSFHVLVRITESWCDLCFGWRYFLYVSFYSCM